MRSPEENTTLAATFWEPYGTSQQGNYVYLEYSAASAQTEEELMIAGERRRCDVWGVRHNWSMTTNEGV